MFEGISPWILVTALISGGFTTWFVFLQIEAWVHKERTPLAKLVSHLKCARSWWYNRRCQKLIDSGKIKTRCGLRDFKYFAQLSKSLAEPDCPVWNGNHSSAVTIAIGRMVDTPRT